MNLLLTVLQLLPAADAACFRDSECPGVTHCRMGQCVSNEPGYFDYAAGCTAEDACVCPADTACVDGICKPTVVACFGPDSSCAVTSDLFKCGCKFDTPIGTVESLPEKPEDADWAVALCFAAVAECEATSKPWIEHTHDDAPPPMSLPGDEICKHWEFFEDDQTITTDGAVPPECHTDAECPGALLCVAATCGDAEELPETCFFDADDGMDAPEGTEIKAYNGCPHREEDCVDGYCKTDYVVHRGPNGSCFGFHDEPVCTCKSWGDDAGSEQPNVLAEAETNAEMLAACRACVDACPPFDPRRRGSDGADGVDAADGPDRDGPAGDEGADAGDGADGTDSTAGGGTEETGEDGEGSAGRAEATDSTPTCTVGGGRSRTPFAVLWLPAALLGALRYRGRRIGNGKGYWID